MASLQPSDPTGPTGKLCNWIDGMSLNDIPDHIRTRSKYIILDGVACALVGAHLPWSETAANAIFDIEPPGDSNIIGWNRKISPVQAALLNSAFIQGFELDDWHSEAPLHSNSIVLPALFAASEHINKSDPNKKISGHDLLLAAIAGYEVGPRVGNGLYGSHMLTLGWHSGAVFGPAAAAAAVAKLMHLPSNLIEDALGIACTQACGLMSAQFESDVKRMQHGFAARNGLLGALLARGKYVGIKKVFERTYGGFLATFGRGSGMDPPYKADELTKALGEKWQTEGIRVKPYAAMAGTHATIGCIRALQEKCPKQLAKLKDIKSIDIEMSEAAFHHGGWKPIRPLTATGAQMSNAFVAATQLVHHQVLPTQFRHDMLEHDGVWELTDVVTCKHAFPKEERGKQSVTITFKDGQTLSHLVTTQRGVEPPLSNEEILAKWRLLTKVVIDEDRRNRIEELVLQLENCADVALLADLLKGETKNPIA